MRIKLDDKHYLNSDAYNLWITTTVTSKQNTVYERLVSGYARTFAQAVDSFIEQYVGSSEATTYQELKNDIEELKKIVKSWEPITISNVGSENGHDNI